MKNKGFYFFILIFSFLFSTSGCSRREETVSCFPIQMIGIDLNLNLASYYALNNIGTAVYINGVGAGNNGLIVVKTSNTTFKAYDRNAPHICPDGNKTILNVVDNIKIVCPKDNATWILISGQPTSVASVPPKTYYTSYNPVSNVLSIYN